MSSPKRVVLILQAVTVTGLLVAAALITWPPDTAVAPVTPTLPALAAAVPPMQTTATALTDSIVNANIFSLAREAPAARTFVAAPVDPVLTDATSGTYNADNGATDSLAVTESDLVPSLYGVVTGPLGAAALLRLDPTRRGAHLYHVGEGVGGYRVRSIGADRVELNGPTGTTVLRLTSRGGTP